MYELLKIFYEKDIQKKEHQAILDNLSEALFSFDVGGLKYFNQLAKKIFFLCVECKADMVPNGKLLLNLQSHINQSKSI